MTPRPHNKPKAPITVPLTLSFNPVFMADGYCIDVRMRAHDGRIWSEFSESTTMVIDAYGHKLSARRKT